jgi:hypothetical protein
VSGLPQAVLPNSLEYAFKVLENVTVPKSQNLVPLILEKMIPLLIFICALGVLTAIQFNDNSSFETREIYNVPVDRLLSPEFCAGHLPRP